MTKFSLIIPVFNRPKELEELLQTVEKQSFEDYEVVVIEDGSSLKSEKTIEYYSSKIKLQYYIRDNVGPALSRNFGASKAVGDYLIFIDSDCLLPSNYLQAINDNVDNNGFDAFGGPDRSHPSFTPIQKAINYAMTSFITTGGIRGGKRQLEKFKPRSFNMGMRKELFNRLNGFRDLRFGEDIDLSLRIEEDGHSAALISQAYVYHKRRSTFKQFFKQVYNSGVARIYLNSLHQRSIKVVHTLPSLFLIGVLSLILLSVYTWLAVVPITVFSLLVFVHSSLSNKNVLVGILSVLASFIQLSGYGSGFIKALVDKKIFGKKPRFGFEKSFYD